MILYNEEEFKINKIAKNFFSISFSNMISQILTFLIGAYYAKVLGPKAFGDLGTIQAIMVYFTLFTLFGLQTYGTREVSKDSDSISKVTGNVLLIRSIMFFVSLFFVFIMCFLFKNDSIMSGLMILYGITLLPSALNIDWVFAGLQQMQYNAVYNIIKSAIPFVLIAVFFKSSDQINLIPIFTGIGLFAGLFYEIYIFFIKEKYTLKIDLDANKAFMLLKYGSPFLVSGILAMINCNVDKIIIFFTRGKIEAGIYNSAYYLILFLTNVETMIFVPVFPHLISLFHQSKMEELKKLCNNTARIVIMVIAPIVLGGIILSKDIILKIFGKSYLNASIPLAILLLYTLLLFVREVYGYGLNAWNKEGSYLKIVTISSMLNLFLNLIFTPFFGMNIAAFITLLSEVVNFALMRKEGEAILSISLFPYIFKVLLPTFLMGIAVIILKILGLNVFINIALSAVIYCLAIIIFRYISTDEIKSFLALKRR